MNETGSGPERPDGTSDLGRDVRQPGDDGGRRSPEAIDEESAEAPYGYEIEGIAEALRARAEEDPPSLGAIWDDATQHVLATYWPDED